MRGPRPSDRLRERTHPKCDPDRYNFRRRTSTDRTSSEAAREASHVTDEHSRPSPPYPPESEYADGTDATPARLTDLSTAAADRIRIFLADSTIKGGASPSDVADLYTAPEIVADHDATTYLDGRYVHGDMPDDWRQLQDDLTAARYDAPPGLNGEALLGRLERQGGPKIPRSIFDDPEDLDEEGEEYEERGARMLDRDPTLADLTPEGRLAIERHLVAEILGYGIAPVRTMQLREWLNAAGDERSLQYLELPFERGERPRDWDALRDRSLQVRSRIAARAQDPTELFARTESAHPHLDAIALLTLLEENLGR